MRSNSNCRYTHATRFPHKRNLHRLRRFAAPLRDRSPASAKPWIATEARKVSSAAHGGYIFKAFAEGSATLALARLRGKVRQGIAQRFLIREGQHLGVPFRRMRGRIDSEGVVVDGQLLPWDEFIELIKVSEGFEIDLHIPFESPR